MVEICDACEHLICDFCQHYYFCLRLCMLKHKRKSPIDGEDCNDYKCFKLKEEQNK